MLEIVKMIVDLFGKFINPLEISKLRRQKRLGDLGAELFLLYVDLNEILIAGEQMIENFKKYLKIIDSRKTSDAYPPFAMPRSWASARVIELEEQFQRIIELRANLFRFRAQLQILNAEAYLKLRLLIDGVGKISILSELNMAVQGNKTMLIMSNDILNDALEMLIKYYKDENYFDRNQEESIRKTLGKAVEEVIPLSDSFGWDENIYKKIRLYIDSGKPRQQLDEIRTILQQLYSTLKDNFSVQDILLEVGDRRLSKRN